MEIGACYCHAGRLSCALRSIKLEERFTTKTQRTQRRFNKNLLFFFISFVSIFTEEDTKIQKQENRRALRPAALFEKRKKRTCYYSGLRVRIRGVLGSFI